jgi:hypothetical protein
MLETAGQPNTPKVPCAGGDELPEEGRYLSAVHILSAPPKSEDNAIDSLHFQVTCSGRGIVDVWSFWMLSPPVWSLHLVGHYNNGMEWDKKEGKEVSQLPTRVGFALHMWPRCFRGWERNGANAAARRAWPIRNSAFPPASVQGSLVPTSTVFKAPGCRVMASILFHPPRWIRHGAQNRPQEGFDDTLGGLRACRRRA